MLKQWYDCPRLVQEEHIHNTVDVATVKNSSDKEFRHLYDAAKELDAVSMMLRHSTIKH